MNKLNWVTICLKYDPAYYVDFALNDVRIVEKWETIWKCLRLGRSFVLFHIYGCLIISIKFDSTFKWTVLAGVFSLYITRYIHILK